MRGPGGVLPVGALSVHDSPAQVDIYLLPHPRQSLPEGQEGVQPLRVNGLFTGRMQA